MPTWDDIPDQAEGQHDRDYPVIPSDLYNGKIVRVGDPFEATSAYGPRTKFVLEWELTGGELREPATLPQFVTLPAKFLSDGFLSDKAGLHKLMMALGFDMDGKINVRPWEWEGKEARVDVETKADAQGVEHSYIQGIRAPRGQRPAAPAAAPARGRQPVAAAARHPANTWEDDDEG